MGTRRFFYFLPGPSGPLNVEKAISVLLRSELEIEPTAFVNSLDESGVFLASRETELQAPVESSITDLLAKNVSIQVLCRDRNIVLSCAFGSPHPSPVVEFNVSRKIWKALESSIRDSYEQMLARVASEMEAETILIVDDPPDDFLGRLQAVDGLWMVDPTLQDGTELEAMTVLVKSDSDRYPDMRSLQNTDHRIGNYVEYRESLDSLDS